MWIHAWCVTINISEFDTWVSSDDDTNFCCRRCAFSGSNYNCAAAIDRLLVGFHAGTKDVSATSECLLMQTYGITLPSPRGFPPAGAIDYVAQKILQLYQPLMLKSICDFGQNRVTAADTRVVFEERLAEATSQALLLISSISSPSTAEQPTNATTRWTNNNCESANYLLKTIINWKPQSLLSLIQHLYQVVLSQCEEVERAIINTGYYKLDPAFKDKTIQRDIWRGITQSARDTHLNNFHSTPRTLN